MRYRIALSVFAAFMFLGAAAGGVACGLSAGADDDPSTNGIGTSPSVRAFDAGPDAASAK